MAGHSKWANIKHKKERSDAKKGKVFSQLAKKIISAVKEGGPDPKGNARLRLVIQEAKGANLPADNIERNIKKASGADQADYNEMLYELYGYGGVALLVEIMTDNKNRIASEMRIVTNKKGGSIASPGSVLFNFERKGVLEIVKSGEAAEEEHIFELAMESGADDFLSDEACRRYRILTSPTTLWEVKELMERAGVGCTEIRVDYLPKHLITCQEQDFNRNMNLIEALEDLEDVGAVFHNLDHSS